MPRFCEKKEADLCNVCAGRDVNQVVFSIRIEWVLPSEHRKLLVDFFKIPRVIELDDMQANLGLRRDRSNVGSDNVRQGGLTFRVQKLEPLHNQIRLATD